MGQVHVSRDACHDIHPWSLDQRGAVSTAALVDRSCADCPRPAQHPMRSVNQQGASNKASESCYCVSAVDVVDVAIGCRN